MKLNPSSLFMETMTIREMVNNYVKTDGKKLVFHPEKLKDFMELLCKKPCEECNGEGYVDYARGEDCERLPCQVCYPDCSWEDLRPDPDDD
jgi:predicted RNA-binding Zn ribbon-like protein